MLRLYLYAANESPRRYSKSQMTGMIKWGQKSKRKKLPGPEITPSPHAEKRNSHAQFPSLKISQN